MLIYNPYWLALGIILFLSVFVVIGLNLTIFADYEEIEIKE